MRNTHDLRGGRAAGMKATPHKHACAQPQQCFQVYLQEVVDGGDRMQHDGEKKRIQSDAGQQERPFGKRREERRGQQSLREH